ncbi:hypothetical protein EVAR_4904_1 [Eumeta japonica]|uniref:Uncharacterized protein n=1 Tax=Eumeta variegata TaxID=151549 RepID=A0A4C1Y1N1_EUMVA|nr:hypothetical protein EVAR_4904_1 [Eumeta japonica]
MEFRYIPCLPLDLGRRRRNTSSDFSVKGLGLCREIRGYRAPLLNLRSEAPPLTAFVCPGASFGAADLEARGTSPVESPALGVPVTAARRRRAGNLRTVTVRPLLSSEHAVCGATPDRVPDLQRVRCCRRVCIPGVRGALAYPATASYVSLYLLS